MSFFKGLVGALKWVVTAPFIAIDYALNALADAGERLRGGVEDLIGVRKKKVSRAFGAKEAVNARIRREWLEVGDAQQLKDDGIEYEGEVYYETVH
jgi:hypothetical protein